jgi:nucleotide-binding universal stress UspA family protein
MYRRWLVAHDFEPCADAAADAAARLALACRRDGASEALIILAHVVTPPALPMSSDIAGGGANVLAVIDLMLRTARERLDDARAALLAAHPGLTVDTVVLSGSPVEGLLDEADRRDVDAIAIGTHGRKGIAHAFLGSVAERIVQRSPRPVFVVKEAPTPMSGAVA